MHGVNRPGRPWLARLDAVLGLLVEVPAALLVLADIGVLFWGVVARFVLHRPLVWSDELASILFLWLAMLGSVIALQRSEHMRMTAVVGRYCSRELAERTSLALKKREGVTRNLPDSSSLVLVAFGMSESALVDLGDACQSVDVLRVLRNGGT